MDWYSQLIILLRASTNNCASTVLSGFTSAIDEFGIPSHNRIDRGGENVCVSEHMLQHPDQGPGRGCWAKCSQSKNRETVARSLLQLCVTLHM